MIVHLTHGTPDVAFRVMGYGGADQVMSWEHIMLCINRPRNKCGEPGSPWYFYGCWPGYCGRLGVDIANPHRHDFPTVMIPAVGLDAEGRILFHVGDMIRNVPPGRYEGELWYAPHNPLPAKPRPPILKVAREERPDIPPEYKIGFDCHHEEKPIPPPPPPRRGCVLARFDIDIGYPCYNHIVTEAAVGLSEGCGYTEEGI